MSDAAHSGLVAGDVMRTYTQTYLGIVWLFGLAACSEETAKTDAGGTTQRDAGGHSEADSGPMSCDAQGTWRVALDASSERCSPSFQPSALTVIVDSDSDGGADDFLPHINPTGPFCTPDGKVTRDVAIAATGCSITASSLTRWCANGERQCVDYQLTLHIRGERAEVEGSYRRCWCGTSGPDGTTVQVKGSAVRE